MTKIIAQNNNNDLFSSSFNLLPQMAFILDEDLNFHDVNQKFLYAFNLEKDQIIGNHFSEVFDSYSIISLIGNFVKSLETQTEIGQNLLINRQISNYRFQFKKFTSNERYILVTGEDRTQYTNKVKELEALKQKIKHMSKLAILGEMASGVSQEINNPLTIIMNNVGQIQRNMLSTEIDRSEVNKKLQKIHQGIQKIHRLSRSIELFSLDNSKDPLQSALVKDIIENSLELCSEKIKNCEINLIIEDIDPNLKLDCKINQLSQIVLNLVGSSMEAIPASSLDRWIKVDAKDYGDFVRFKFTDSTPALDEELRMKVWNSLSEGEHHELKKGLGLSISKDIIEDHYGKFQLSEENNHNAFIFDIPKGLSLVA